MSRKKSLKWCMRAYVDTPSPQLLSAPFLFLKGRAGDGLLYRFEDYLFYKLFQRFTIINVCVSRVWAEWG